jgi:Glycoside hydrolase family 44
MIEIDTTVTRAISPYIYGVNFPDWSGMSSLRIPLARQGGNRMTAYNWENNASNAGSDWKHQNDAYLDKTDEPGHTARVFLEGALSHGAAAILTVPMAGYVAADKKGDGDVNQTPSFLQTRFKRSLPKKSGKLVYPPDTKDATVYQDEFVAWIERQRGKGEVWYALDNEPDIWAGTHARIVPKTPTYAAFLERSIAYASAIKSVAPQAKVCGPVSYGWQGFRRFQDASDANNREFLEFYLAGMRAAEKKTGKRLLDCLDLHYYPEAQGASRITEDKPGNAAARIQAPRSLWDASYIEKSWITQSLGNKPVVLLPRVLKQIATHYPGTKLALTEYHFGGRNEISGALSQADLLGIYGRYGVYAACIWGMSAKDTAQLAGFRAFLGFGDLGLKVTGETPAENSVYAARDGKRPGSLRVVALNKTEQPRPFMLTLRGFAVKSATGTAVTAAALTRSVGQPVRVQGGKVSFTAPPLSIVTLSILA